jgi:DNA mismatch repair protein MutS
VAKKQILHIDYQTITELELLRQEGTGQTIFEILNRTTTPGGKDLLKSKFRYPSNQFEQIRNIQETIKFLISHRKQWNLLNFKNIMDQVEYYYYSKAEPVTSKNKIGISIEGMIYQIKFRNYQKTIKKGARNAIRFIFLLHELFIKNQSDKLPIHIHNIFSELDQIFNINYFRKLLKKGSNHVWSIYELFYYDKVFREFHKEQMLRLINLTYELDALLSMADATSEYRLTFPEFIQSDKTILEFDNVYHLFLEKPTKNSTTFDTGQNFLFLTGPNMAGKTTFLKSCAIAVFLAHLGMGVPANSMKLVPFNCIFSSLNTTDNLSIGYSYFYSEVVRIKKAAETLKHYGKSFMIFDELFKGTNIKDAFDGSSLVIDGLVKWKSSIFILSSHLLELENKIKKYRNVFFQYFDSSVINGRPVFNFQLYKGLSTERLGLIILKNEQIEKLLEPGRYS